MKVKGEIHFIYQEQVISDKFKKREVIIKTTENEQYPEYPVFEFHQDKCSLADNFQVGQMVDIEFNLKGRIVEVKGVNRAFNTLQIWKISASQ